MGSCQSVTTPGGTLNKTEMNGLGGTLRIPRVVVLTPSTLSGIPAFRILSHKARLICAVNRIVACFCVGNTAWHGANNNLLIARPISIDPGDRIEEPPAD